MNLKRTLIIATLLVSGGLAAQTTDAVTPAKKEAPKSKAFGAIYTGFYTSLNNNVSPKAAFEFKSGLFGYMRNLSENVKATLIYDVYKTTRDIQVTDTSGNILDVKYAEGSKYTAFLKQGEIDWKVNKYLELSIGQLLNEQYLTVLDKFWGYRYIDYTYQERLRYGSPADFGARAKLYLGKFKYSLTVMNGDGPFKYQDANSTFLIANNLEYRPNDKFIFKVYYDLEPISEEMKKMNKTLTFPNKAKTKHAISGFVGYKADKFKVGAECNMVINSRFVANQDYNGASIYSAYKVTDKIDVLARYDYIGKSALLEDGHYIIAGFQYSPVKRFMTSINYRHSAPGDIQMIYLNAGVKF